MTDCLEGSSQRPASPRLKPWVPPRLEYTSDSIRGTSSLDDDSYFPQPCGSNHYNDGCGWTGS